MSCVTQRFSYWHSCPKTVLKFRGLGVSFQALNHFSGGGGTAPHFCIYGSSPTEQVFLSNESRMCLFGEPFVSKKGAARAEESCGFELEKRPPDPCLQSI